MDYFNPCIDPFKDLFSGGVAGFVPKLMGWTNFMEFCASSSLAIITCQFANDPIKVGLAFALLYTVLNKQLVGFRLRANPLLSMADWMVGSRDAGSGWDVVFQALNQCLGWAWGLFLAGLIKLPSKYATPTIVNGDFTGMLIDEVLSSGFLVWLWLHVHDQDRNGSWKDFMGVAVGLALWLAATMKSANAHMNPAVQVGVDMNAATMRSYGVYNFLAFFSPIISAFITSLVYTYFKN
jgi:hypothetical protein